MNKHPDMHRLRNDPSLISVHDGLILVWFRDRMLQLFPVR